MALARQPEYLLLDEPTTYLDIAHQLEVMEIIKRLNREHAMTVIMVLHDINHALQYADEIAVIKDKRIFSRGTPHDVLNVAMLAEVFGVHADIFTNSQGAQVLFRSCDRCRVRILTAICRFCQIPSVRFLPVMV